MPYLSADGRPGLFRRVWFVYGPGDDRHVRQRYGPTFKVWARLWGLCHYGWLPIEESGLE